MVAESESWRGGVDGSRSGLNWRVEDSEEQETNAVAIQAQSRIRNCFMKLERNSYCACLLTAAYG